MKNPTLFTLLKMGCKVEFPSGYVLIGDPENRYIDTKFTLDKHLVGDGVRILDKDGVRLAMNDEKHYRKHKNQ